MMKEQIPAHSVKQEASLLYKGLHDGPEAVLDTFLSINDRIQLAAPEWIKRFFPQVFLYYHPDDIETIWIKEHDHLQKDGFFYDFLREHYGEGLFTMPSGEVWKMHQKLVGPQMIPHKFSGLPQDIKKVVDDAFDSKEDDGASEKTISHVDKLMRMASLQIATKVLFDTTLTKKEADELDHAFGVMKSFAQRNTFLVGVPAKIGKVLPIFDAKLYDSEEKVKAFVEKVRTISHPQESLISSLHKKNSSGVRVLTDDQIQDEITNILYAAYGTTSTAITTTLHLLALKDNQHYQDAIRNGANPDPANHSDTDSLLRATVLETLRLSPPVYITGRKVSSDIETQNDRGPVAIPKGSIVLISPYLTHRHPEFWRDPQLFNPERFMGPQEKPDQNSAFIPFGSGPRKCIGEHFGIDVNMRVVKTLIDRYSFSTNQEYKPVLTSTLRPTNRLSLDVKKI